MPLLQLTNASVPRVSMLNTGLEFTTDADGFYDRRIPILKRRCSFWMQNANSLPI